MKISVYLISSGKVCADSNMRQVCFRVREGSADLRARSGLFADPDYWDADIPGYKRTTKLPKGEIKALNQKIEDITVMIHERYTEGCDGSWLRNLVKDCLAGEDEVTMPTVGHEAPVPEDEKSFVALFREYIAQSKVCKQRLSSINGTLKKIERFQLYNSEILGKKGFALCLDSLSATDMQDIWDYIMEEHRFYAMYPDFYSQFHFLPSKAPVPLSHNFITNIFRHIRSFLNWALKQGLTANERWRGFSVRREAYGTPIYLTLEERDRILSTDLSGFPRLERHRDMFIFQCLVGGRAGDLYRMTADNIKDGFLEYYPHKTIGNDGRPYGATLCRVPLNDKARTLLAKYDGISGRSLFPCLNKASYNEDIKVITLIAGVTRTVVVTDPKTNEAVKKPIYIAVSSHTARRTFIANLYRLVKDPNLIASMTGHSLNSKAFRRYRAIAEDMKHELVNMID